MLSEVDWSAVFEHMSSGRATVTAQDIQRASAAIEMQLIMRMSHLLLCLCMIVIGVSVPGMLGGVPTRFQRLSAILRGSSTTSLWGKCSKEQLS